MPSLVLPHAENWILLGNAKSFKLLMRSCIGDVSARTCAGRIGDDIHVYVLTLTNEIKPLSRLIADEFPNAEFVADNMALIAAPPSSSIGDYLRGWQSHCRGGSSVPELLMSKLEI